MRYKAGELSVGQILDQSFNIFKDHYKLLLTIAAVLYFPLILLQGLLQEMFTVHPTSGTDYATLAASQYVVLGIVVVFTVLALVCVGPLTAAALTVATSNVYMDKPITVKECIRQAFSRMFAILWTGLLTGILMMLGFMLCVLPGMYLALTYYVVYQVVILEGINGSKAMGRSNRLMKGSLGIAMVLMVLMFVVSLSIGASASIVSIPVVTPVVNAVVQTVITAFWTVTGTVLYFHCRSKVEAYDLQLLAESVAQDDLQQEPDRNLPPLPTAE